MINRSSTTNKFAKINIISLGLLILGICFICWALVHILSKPNLPVSSQHVVPVVHTSPGQYATTEEFITSPLINNDEILYPVRPQQGDTIGSLIIPALDQKLSIIHGTDEDELVKGVGHYAQSVLPGENNNSVLSGHRDTVFRELGKLNIGDQLIVQSSAGTFTYEITNTQIVDKDDKTIITPTDHAVLTVTTCYPFIYIGDAPDRYILSADLVKRE